MTAIDKYEALQNTIDWIKNSSIEEFMETFNKLGDNYSGPTLGDVISNNELKEVYPMDINYAHFSGDIYFVNHEIEERDEIYQVDDLDVFHYLKNICKDPKNRTDEYDDYPDEEFDCEYSFDMHLALNAERIQGIHNILLKNYGENSTQVEKFVTEVLNFIKQNPDTQLYYCSDIFYDKFETFGIKRSPRID